MTATTRIPARTASATRPSNHRRLLLASTALVGSALLASNAHAQALPDLANAGGASVTTSGGPPATRSMTIDLNDASRVLDFNSYNIGAGNTVNYTTTTAGTTDLVAVNRVLTGGGASLIDGLINADDGISVWLINQEGITYNGRATFAGGSLMLSTLDFTDTVDGAFRTSFAVAGAANATSYNFAGPGTGAITINTGGTNFSIAGSIVAVSPTITTNQALTAGNGSVVLVAGTDVTFTAGLGNPLSFTVNAGTPIGGGVTVNDDLTGQSVVLAGGLQNNLTATLLNVDAAANLTATAANGAVVLATATTTYGAQTATITNGANAQPSIRNDGNLAATGANGDVVINSAHDITGAGGGTAQRNLTLDAVRDINVTGNYEATNGALTANAGRDGTFAGLKAGTDVTVQVGRDASFAGTVESGSGNVDLNVFANADISGTIDAGDEVFLDVRGDLTQSGNTTAVNNVTYGIGNDATVTGSLEGTAGYVEATVGNDGTFAAVTAGTDIDLSAGRDLTTTGTQTADGAVTLAAATSGAPTLGDLRVQGNVSAGDVFTAEGNSVTLGLAGQTRLQQAAGAINVTAAQRDVTGVGTLTLQSSGGGDITLRAPNGVVNFARTTTSIDANSGDVVVESAPTITLGNVTAANLYTYGDTRLTATGDIRTGNLSIDNHLVVYSTNGSVLTGNVTVNTLGEALEIYANGNPGDITTGNLRTNHGDIYVSAFRDVDIGDAVTAPAGLASAPTGASIAVLAGRDIDAGNLSADIDVYTRSGGASTIAGARAGDDVTLFANGVLDATNVTVTGLGADTSSLSVGGAGAPGSVVPVPLEDLSLTGHQVRLGSLDTVISSGLIENLGLGNVEIDAPTLIDVNLVTANTGAGYIRLTSTGGNIRATSLTAASLVDVDAFADATIGYAGAGTIDVDAGGDASVGIGEAGSLITIDAGDDIGSATRLVTANGNTFLNATDAVTVNRVEANGTGSVGILGGGTVQTGALVAGHDVAVRGGTTGAGVATNVTVGSAVAGDDIDLVALNGNLTLTGNGTANATPGNGGTAVTFGTPGASGAVGVTPIEELQLVQSTIRLRSATGDVTSGGTLTTANGDIIVNAARDASLNVANASAATSGGSIAVRAGRDVTSANNLTSNHEDVSIGAVGNIALGTITAADDIDLLAGGRITGTSLRLTGNTERARFADVTSGSAGAVGGVTFTTPDDADLALANIVRIRAGDVGNGAAGPVGLIVDTVVDSTLFNARALAGDIRLGDINSNGAISVIADNGSVTGLPNGYAPVTGLSISGADTVNINVTGTGIFGNIYADTVRTVVNPGTLRIGEIQANTIDLAAVNTIDIGDIRFSGTVNLLTTGGAPASGANVEIIGPDTKLVEGYGDANLYTHSGFAPLNDAPITVLAQNGVAQLGNVFVGGNGLPVNNYANVTALAMTVDRVQAGTFRLEATEGLLRIDYGKSATHAVLIKGDASGTSIGSNDTTDVLQVTGNYADFDGARGIFGRSDVDIRSETSALVASATAEGINNATDKNVFVSAARNVTTTGGLYSYRGSVGVYAGAGNAPGNVTVNIINASQDATIQARGDITVTTAFVGDDIDFASTFGNIRLDRGETGQSGFPDDMSSVQFSGTPGQPATIAVVATEQPAMAGRTIRLRSERGSIQSATNLTTTGDVIVNAATDAALTNVSGAFVGILAGGDVTGNTLIATQDLRVQAGDSITIASATAGDDIDMLARNDLSLVNGTAQGSDNAVAVTFGTAGALDAVAFDGTEDADLATNSTIRLETNGGSVAGGDITSGGLLEAAGDVLVNAGGSASLNQVRASGSIGVTGAFITANDLTASRDVTIEAGTGFTVQNAEAGDDIDTRTLLGIGNLVNGTAHGVAGTGGTSAVLGSDGRMHVVSGEDASFANLSSIRMRAASGEARSSGTLLTEGRGDILVSSGTDASLNIAEARDGSIGVLANRDVTANAGTSTLTASRDVRVQAGRDALLRNVVVGDDIDVVAGNRLTVFNGQSLGTPGADGTNVVFGSLALPTAVMIVAGAEDAQLAGSSTIRLRSTGGDIAGDFGTTPITGATLNAAAGDVIVNTNQSVTLVSATATTGSVGVLAGGTVTAGSLVAGIDVGVRGTSNVTVNTATAGNDIDLLSLQGNVTLTSGTATGTSTGTRSVDFTAAGTEGTVGAVTFGTAEAADLSGSSIRLRSEQLDVNSAGTLQTSLVGNIVVNARSDAALNVVDARAGSVGVLAGRDASANTVTASGDTLVNAGRDAALGRVTAGDDVDVIAGNNLALVDGKALATGSVNTSHVTVGGLAGADNALVLGAAEDGQLTASTIRLRAVGGNIAGDFAATPIAGTTLNAANGEILVNAAGNVTIANATATLGHVGVLAGGAVNATTLVAGRDIAVQAGTFATIATATAGDDLDVVALNGLLTLDDGTSTGLGAGGTSVSFGSPGSLGAVGIAASEDADLAANATIRLRAANGGVTSATRLRSQGTGNVLVNASGAAQLNTVTASGGSIAVLAGTTVNAASLTASRDIAAKGGTGVTIALANAGDDIDALAVTGNLVLTDGTSTGLGAGGNGAVFSPTLAAGSAGAVTVAAGEEAEFTGSSTIRLRAAAGDVSSGTVLRTQGTGDILVNAAGNAGLTLADAQGGSVGVLAGTDVSAATLTASRDVAVSAGRDAIITMATAGDDIDVLAGNAIALSTGTANATTGSGGTTVAFGAAGADHAVTVGAGETTTFANSTISLRAVAGSVTGVVSPATGATLSTQRGDILVNAKVDATILDANARNGSVVMVAGRDVNATTLTATEDIAAAAGRDGVFGTLTAGDDIDLTATGRVTTNGVVRTAIGTTGADARQALLDPATAGTANGLRVNAGDARGAKSLPTGSTLANELNGRTITIEASAVTIGNTIDVGSTGRLIVRNGAAAATATTVVGGAAVSNETGFVVDGTELNRLQGKTVVVDSGTKALELKAMTIGAATGTTDLRFLGTRTVDITGEILSPDARTLQIGGTLGDLDKGTLTQPVAESIVARIDQGARIEGATSTIELRGSRILFGTDSMVNDFLAMAPADVARQVSNPGSKIYGNADPAVIQVVKPFLVARQVTVGYKDFALFQNTQPGFYKGVEINSPAGKVPTLEELALRLVSTGDTDTNSFAMFGKVNGFIDTSAALLGNQAVEISNPEGDPNSVRITRSASRLNGCIIGAPDKGCLATDIPQPQFNLYDERVVALFDADDDSTIAVSPLIGRGNDGLIVNVADAPVGIDTIECRPEDPNCPTKEGE